MTGRLVSYVRVSAVMGRGEDLLSPDLQLRGIRDMASRDGLKEVAVVQDIDVSGRSFARDGIDRVMAMAQAGEVDVLGVLNLSRFGRNTGESLRHITELRRLGVSVLSASEKIDASPEGQFMLSQFLSMAQLYSDQIGRGWAQTARLNAERGYLHGQVPLGYRRVPPRAVEPDPFTAPVVVRIFTDWVGGLSYAAIAREVGPLLGVRTRPTTVREILRNPAYNGQVMFKGQVWPGLHEPLVSERLWEQAQRRIAVPRPPSRTVQAAHSLAGLVRCSACGLALKRKDNGRPAPRGRLAYVCSGHETRACPGSGVGAPPCDALEAKVLEEIVLLAQRLRTDERAVKDRAAARAGARRDVTRLNREVEKIDRALAGLATKLALEVLTDHAYQAAAQDLEVKRARLVAEVQAAQQTTDAPSTITASYAERIVKGWPGWSPQIRNGVLRELIRQVVVDPPRVRGEPVAERTHVTFL